jgi:hypothetical protein
MEGGEAGTGDEEVPSRTLAGAGKVETGAGTRRVWAWVLGHVGACLSLLVVI